MRRDVSTILLTHRMDPERKELYVEGMRDKLFIKWIAGDNLSQRALVQEISSVHIEDDRGSGNRGRLLEFASQVVGEPAQIRFLVDQDFDPYLPGIQDTPENVWKTDGRDLESYCLREDCFEKITLLAMGTELYDGRQLLRSLIRTARTIACVRLYSAVNDLDLAFQTTNLRRSVQFDSGEYVLDVERYVTTLLQNSDTSVSEVPTVLSGANDICAELADARDTLLIHGKDALELLGMALARHGIDRKAAAPILRTSFDRALVEMYPNLAAVHAYVTED